MMDVPHHIRLMSNDNSALRRRRAIRHLRTSLPSSMSTCRRVIGRVWRRTLFLLIILHPSRLPPRHARPSPSPPNPPTFTRVGATKPRLTTPSVTTAIQKFHHFQSDRLKTEAGLRLHPSFECLKNFQQSGRKVGQQEAKQRSAACDQSQPVCR